MTFCDASVLEMLGMLVSKQQERWHTAQIRQKAQVTPEDGDEDFEDIQYMLYGDWCDFECDCEKKQCDNKELDVITAGPRTVQMKSLRRNMIIWSPFQRT